MEGQTDNTPVTTLQASTDLEQKPWVQRTQEEKAPVPAYNRAQAIQEILTKYSDPEYLRSQFPDKSGRNFEAFEKLGKIPEIAALLKGAEIDAEMATLGYEQAREKNPKLSQVVARIKQGAKGAWERVKGTGKDKGMTPGGGEGQAWDDQLDIKKIVDEAFVAKVKEGLKTNKPEHHPNKPLKTK